MRTCFCILLIALGFTLLHPAPAAAYARLVSVTPLGDGCVSGPTGSHVESWDVELLKTYVLTLDWVTDCANGGTDPTINVMLQDSVGGNVNVVATRVSTGVYSFQFTAPAQFCLTAPALYCCATLGDPSTGIRVGRHDTGLYQAHLRFSIFGAGCTNPVPRTCAVPARQATWGSLKIRYR